MIEKIYEYVNDNEFRFTVYDDKIHIINYKRIITLEDNNISFYSPNSKISIYGNKLARKIAENVVYYAKHKYSSNVVEKCFDRCDGKDLSNLMSNVQKKENLADLILDEHGNYVVQKVLSLSDENTRRTMLKQIVPLFDKLKNFPYGEKVIARLRASYPMINNIKFMEDQK